MNLHDRIFNELASARDGLGVADITTRIGLAHADENASVIEALLLLSRRCARDNDRWVSSGNTKMTRVLAAIESYAQTSGKRVFRLSAALAHVPTDEQPTIDELESALTSSGSLFQLLPNAMIKKVTS